jgi:hypothetical protein
MLKRGWISAKPLKKAIAIKQSVEANSCTERYKRVLRLCLVSEVVQHASNVKFGPEIYCAAPKTDVAVFSGFNRRLEQVAGDLDIVESFPRVRATVVEGDSRRSSRFLRGRSFTHCICSPPYPTEHDYTRNSRLELAFLEHVNDIDSLRKIKKSDDPFPHKGNLQRRSRP